MKAEIIRLLKSCDGYLSGQELCEKLNVSRTAVWKVINQLREEGYEIEAVRNKGYRLVESADVMTAAELESCMGDQQLGLPVKYYDKIDSTNNQVRRLAEEGAEEGLLVVAECQGYPVVNLKAVLYDGSYHPVDSSEIAFKTAAQLAYKAAMPEANPVLLEPVGELKVVVPDSYMGDVIGDLNKRRGRVMGMNPTGDGEQEIEAEVPMAEMTSYAIDLRAMTQSRGSYTFHFVRYEDCPPAAQEKAIAAAKALADE